jgi:hypothetical protein
MMKICIWASISRAVCNKAKKATAEFRAQCGQSSHLVYGETNSSFRHPTDNILKTSAHVDDSCLEQDFT